MAPPNRFLEAWKIWDEACSRSAKKGVHVTARTLVGEAAKLEVTSQEVAEELGLSVTDFREKLAILRRQGLTREQALKRVTNPKTRDDLHASPSDPA